MKFFTSLIDYYYQNVTVKEDKLYGGRMIDKKMIEYELVSTLQLMDEASKDRNKYKEFKKLRKKVLELQQMLWRAQK